MERLTLSLIANYSMFLTVSVNYSPDFVLTNLTFEIITKLGPADDYTTAYYMACVVQINSLARTVLIKGLTTMN